MSETHCCSRCKTSVPPELEAVGWCLTHFLASVEQTCAEMHREIVLRGADAERRAAVAGYIRESAQLLAQVGSSLRLSDDCKRRILSCFLCLMNLREKLDRISSVRAVERRPVAIAAVVSPAEAAG